MMHPQTNFAFDPMFVAGLQKSPNATREVMVPPAERVLFDGDLLAGILRELKDYPAALMRAARVNKSWFEVAMGVVWRDVPAGGIRPILHALPEFYEGNVSLIPCDSVYSQR